MIKQRKKSGHSCSRHPRGRPKIGHGACCPGEVRPAVRERIRGKRIERTWRTAADLDDVED